MKRTADRRQKPEVGWQMAAKSWGSGNLEVGRGKNEGEKM